MRHITVGIFVIATLAMSVVLHVHRQEIQAEGPVTADV